MCLNVGSACLCNCFQNESKGFVGGLDTQIKEIDFTQKTFAVVGEHTKAISCMEWSNSINAL